MSWVDDARKLPQDFVAPELRAMTAQLNAVHELLPAADRLAAERHAAVLERLEQATRELDRKIELALVTRKLEELQEKQAPIRRTK